jgi:hypothetical protein
MSNARELAELGQEITISSGRVGIGSNIVSPKAGVHIDKGTDPVPDLLLDSGGNTTGDIAVPDGEILQIGHFDTLNDTFTLRCSMSSGGDFVFRDGTNETFKLHASTRRVGLNVALPDGTLHVRDPNTTPKIRLDNSTSPRDNGLRCEGSDNIVLYADAEDIGVDSYIDIEVDSVRIARFQKNDLTAAQSSSPVSGGGNMEVDAISTSLLVAQGETGSGGTGIGIGDSAVSASGQAIAGDEISLFANGDHVLLISGPANSTTASVRINSNAGYSGSSTDPNTGTKLLELFGDTDSLAVTNNGSGDYALVNTQQGNGINFYDGSGGMRFYYGSVEKANIDATGFSTSSDIRFKDVQGDYIADALGILNAVTLFEYLPKATHTDVAGDAENPMYGFSAQELYALDPTLVNRGADDLDNDPEKLGQYTVNDTSIKAALIRAIQQLTERNASLEARIAALEAQ